MSSTTETPSKRRTFETIKDMPYCDPSKRMDFVLFFEVHQGNPNGDPDAGNLPRIDPTDNHGIVTDVATKRKIRDYFQSALDRPIFIQNKTALNTAYFDVANKAVEDGSQLPKSVRDAVSSLAVELAPEASPDFKALLAEPCGAEDDPMSFAEWLSHNELNNSEFDPESHVFRFLGESKGIKEIGEELVGEGELQERIQQLIRRTGKGQKPGLAALVKSQKAAQKKGSMKDGRAAMKDLMCAKFDDIRLFGAVLTAGTNAGQIRGPMQLTFARSLKPIIPIESSITRIAITKASDFLKKQTEMGRKPWVSWAAYEQHGFYNAPLGAPPNDERAGGTGVTRDDLARFWEAIANMFPEAKSAANGRMNVCDLIVFVHDDEKGRGCAPFHLLRKKIVLNEKPGSTEFTKGFDEVYQPLVVESEEKLRNEGISVHRPLRDLWPNL